MMVWKIIFLFNWVMFRFHVNLPGCIYVRFLGCFFLSYQLPMDRGTFARLRPLAKDVRLQITNQWAEQRWTQLLSEDRIKAVPWIHLVKVVGEVDVFWWKCWWFWSTSNFRWLTVGTLATCCCSFRWCQKKCFFSRFGANTSSLMLGFRTCGSTELSFYARFHPFSSPYFFPLRFATPKKYRFEVRKSTVDAFGLEDISQSCGRSLVVIPCRYIVSTNNG